LEAEARLQPRKEQDDASHGDGQGDEDLRSGHSPRRFPRARRLGEAVRADGQVQRGTGQGRHHAGGGRAEAQQQGQARALVHGRKADGHRRSLRRDEGVGRGLLDLAGEVDRGSGRVGPALPRSDARRGLGDRDPSVLRGGGLRQDAHAGAARPGGAPPRGDRPAAEVVSERGGPAMASKTSQKIFPFLWDAKEAEEADRFYASIFPDSRVDRVSKLLSESPSGPPGSVQVVDFTLFGQRFQAMSAGPHHEFNDAISMVVQCDDQKELDRYWDALLERGGKPQACGWLIDRFGVRWQIVPAMLSEMMRGTDAARSKRVTDAMLKMVKLDIATLEKAARS